jgi:hypothetical protein
VVTCLRVKSLRQGVDVNLGCIHSGRRERRHESIELAFRRILDRSLHKRHRRRVTHTSGRRCDLAGIAIEADDATVARHQIGRQKRDITVTTTHIQHRQAGTDARRPKQTLRHGP